MLNHLITDGPSRKVLRVLLIKDQEKESKAFSKSIKSDLVFDQIRPNFNLVRDFIKTNILTTFHKYLTEKCGLYSTHRFF